MKVCSKPNSRKQGKQLAHYKVDLHKKKKRKKNSHKCVLKISRNIHTFSAICRACSFGMAFTTACQRASPTSPSLAKAQTSAPPSTSEEKMHRTRGNAHLNQEMKMTSSAVDFLNTKPLSAIKSPLLSQ